MSLKPPVSNKDHIQGEADAIIELVEYGDYQCPYCGMAYPLIKNIQKKFGKDLKFIFRNFPLSEIHPHAKLAAIAAEAADKQERFWEMHDIIFENQKNLSNSSLIAYANEVGLDIFQFKTDMNDEILVKKIESDFESGLRSGVNGTPSFFINGEKYNANWDEGDLTNFITKKIVLIA
jgi:protein-disulfide isomerase